MNSKKKNIDELFKTRLQNEQAGFDPLNWDKMASILDKQFVTPPVTSNIVSGLSSFVKVLIVSVSISVPVILYIYFGTNIIKSKSIVNEKNIEIKSINTKEHNSNNDLQNNISDSINLQEYKESKSANNQMIEPKSNKQFISQHINGISQHIESKIRKQEITVEKPGVPNDSVNNVIDKSIGNENIIISTKNVDLLKNGEVKTQSISVESKSETMDSKPITVKGTDTLIITESDNSIFPVQKYRGIYAYLGINYSNSFSNISDQKPSWSLSPVFGIGYEKRLNKYNLSVMFEINYIKSPGHSYEKTIISTSYFLNQEKVITTLNTQNLDFIRIPVICKYHYRKHNFMTGLYFSYLLDSESKLTESVINYKDNKSEVSEVKGYRDGFNDFSYGFIFGYSYKVCDLFDLGCRLNYNFNDLSKDSYYPNSKSDKMIDFQLNIMWKLY